MARIFINYRRQDSEHAVGRLAEDLRRHFAHDQVFEDIHSIDPGADFVDALNKGLEECAAALVVIGPGWLSAADQKGRRRLDDPDDWVRQEIVGSLGRKDVRVFPVLVGGAEMPATEDLPEPLRSLARRQAFELTSRHWANDVDLLVEHLERVPGLAGPVAATKLPRQADSARSPKPVAGAVPATDSAPAFSPPPTEPAVSRARTESPSAGEPASGRPGLPWKPLAIFGVLGVIVIGAVVSQQSGRQQPEPAVPPLSAPAPAPEPAKPVAEASPPAAPASEKPAQEPAVRIFADAPGTVVSVPATQGATIKRGEVLIVVESMTVKTHIRAPFAGVVATLPLQPGEPFSGGAVLATLERDRRDPPPHKAEPAPAPEPTKPVAEVGPSAAPAPEKAVTKPPVPAPQKTDLAAVPTSAPERTKPAAEPGPEAAPAPQPGQSFRDCDQCPDMVVVPAGSFAYSPEDGPQHTVTIARPFAVGKFELTFDEWDACVAAGGCTHRPADRWGRGRQPVIGVGWYDAKQYVAWLSKKTGKTYRLLSEAEWDYAARAGTTTAYPWGNEPGRNRANFLDSGSQWSGKQTAPVGSFERNAFGLHDMIGNVWEWLQDCQGFPPTPPSDGSAWESATCGQRWLRGGAWNLKPEYARVARRASSPPGHRNDSGGFRVARTL